MQAEKGDLNSMQITDVRVRKVTKEGKLKAVVSITIDNEFVVHDIKVIEGEKGLFIAMPSKKALDGEYRDIAHPSIPVQEKRFRIRYWIGIRNLWKQIRKNLGKCKKRKIRAAAVSWINDEVAAVFKKREKLRKNGIPVKMVKY